MNLTSLKGKANVFEMTSRATDFYLLCSSALIYCDFCVFRQEMLHVSLLIITVQATSRATITVKICLMIVPGLIKNSSKNAIIAKLQIWN